MKGRSFGDRVFYLRTARRMTKSELARRLGIKVQTLWAIEAGQSKWTQPRTLFRMADLFGVDARELALGKAKRTTNGTTHEAHALFGDARPDP
jgi:transcriptional regulator with XRE-family HTH domain